MSTKQTLKHYRYAYLSIRQRGLAVKIPFFIPFWAVLLFFSCLSLGRLSAQNPIAGNQGFQILSEGDFTFTGYTHVHGALGVGGNLTLNCSGVLAEICMDGQSSYVFPGDGVTSTGLLVKGGINWTNGGAKVMGGKYLHIGNSTGCIQSDNGVNMATQVLPTGGTYNQAKRIEGALDQTPSPSPFQAVAFDFATLFNTYRTTSTGMAACPNTVQLYNASNVAISGNTVSSAQNVQINSLSNGVNVLNLTSASLNNLTELKFNSGAMPSASKLLVINVPLTGNFTWNNCNLPGLSGASNGAYIIWNFYGNSTYNLTINTASLIIGTIFAPNHNLIKSGTGDIDGGIYAKNITLGLGEVHLFNFSGNVPICNTGGLGCTNILGNPEFDYGTSRWGLWANTGNTATWTVNTASQLSGANSAFIDLGTVVGGAANAWQVQFMQGGYPIYSGKSYTVSFQAKATSNRNITVSLLQTVSPYTTYTSQNVAITTAKNTYTVTFPVTTTDLNTVGLYFMLGESNADVYLDNIVWSEQCGTQTCSNGAGTNLISNSEMDFGTNGWTLGVQGGASATYSVNTGSQLSGTNSIFVNIATTTGTNWHVQLAQAGRTVVGGKSYRVSFKAKATSNRNMYVSFQQNYSPWSEIDGQTVALTTTMQTYNLTFTANMDDARDVGLYFHLGESNADVYIDDVEWAELCNTEVCNNSYDDDSDGYIDGADSDCAVCDAPTYGFQNGILKSGTALSPGAVYRFSNVTPGTDVEVKVNSFSHPDITISSMDLSAYDAPGGYNLAFQPQVLYGWANANGTFDSPGERYVDFTFSFFDAGTNNPQEFSKMVLSAIDVDGDGGSVMEFIQSSGFSAYEINSPTALTLSGALKAKSNISNATNIDETALNHMISFDFEHKTSINVRYGADWNGASNTFADNRLNSMYFKCYALNTQVACPTVTVSGQYSVCTGVSQTLTSSTSGGSGSKTYQWQSSSDNQTWTNIAGATGNSYNTGIITAKTHYRLAVTFSGNPTCGAIYSDDFPVTPGACVENCSNGVDDNGNGLVDGADLDCATLCPTGNITFQRWNNIGGTLVTDLTSNASYPNSPSTTGYLSSFDGPDNIADNYGTRVVGYITPTITGNYTFNLTGDDYCQLYLSTNAYPSNKILIASVNGWTNQTEYNKYSSQTSSPYYLQAGRNYYVELFQKEAGGGDHFQVYWKTPSNSNWNIIPGANLRPFNCTEVCGNGTDDDNDGYADCLDTDCNGFSYLSLDFSANLPPALVSGTANAVGAVYRFTGVASGVDALVTIKDIKNVTTVNALFTYGLHQQITGIPANNPYIDYDISLVNTGTNTPIPATNLVLSAYDIDGLGNASALFSDYIIFKNVSYNYVLTTGTKLVAVSAGSKDYKFSEAISGGMYADDPNGDNPDYGVVANYAGVNSFGVRMGMEGAYNASANRSVWVKGKQTDVQDFAPAICLPVEQCSNGIDDDGDGLVDIADPDCITSFCGTGSLTLERWTGISGTTISNLTSSPNYPNTPSFTGSITSFDGPDNVADNYGTRVRGYIVPSITGTYTFNLTGDDDCVLYLSTTVAPANKVQIANISGYTGTAEYTKYTSQTSSNINLVAGQKYYVELLQKEGGGGDHFQVYWKTPSSSTWTIVPSANLIPYICVEICGNGIDDDNNGLADCADPTCNLSSFSAQPVGGTICNGGTFSLSATATGSPAFQWQSSTNNSTFTNISGATSASYTTPALTTTTYYRVVITSNGCSNTSSVATVAVVADPAITTHPASATVCSGLTQTLSVVATGGTPSLTYQWQSSLDNITFLNIAGATSASFTTPALLVKTYYRVVVSATGNGCGSVTSNVATVSIGASLTPVITGNTSICAGTSTSLTTSGGGTYAWSNGATTSAIVVVPTSTTTYTVTVTNVTGCTGTAQATVTVNAKPTVNAGLDATICSGSSANLNATASGGTSPYTFAWSNSLGAGQSKTVTPTTTTTYTVTVTSATGCTSTDQVVVNVNQAPAVTVNSNITICKNTNATLTLTTTGGVAPYTYAWSNGLGSGTSVTVSPTATTTYSVTVTGANGCTSTGQATVTVNALPVANAGADVTICNLSGTTLTASGAGAPSPFSYNWSNGVTTASQPITPVSTTTYTVTVTSSNGCFATDQVVVTVQACTEICGNGTDDDSDGLADCSDSDCGPSANAGSDMSICPGNSAFLSVGVTGGSQPYTYAWNNGLGSGATKVVSPTTTTTYTVTVTSASGCTSTDQVKVTVMACSENCTNGVDDDADGLVDCDDPDCSGVTAPVLVDDNYSTCPGMAYSNRVTYNDDNLNNPIFSIVTQPTSGTVTIDGTGKFFYTPNGFDCVTDHFTYEVCNQGTGCCETANVNIVLSDNTAPQLTNVPADLTISCDDAVPSAPVVTAFDQCPGIYMDFEEASSQNQVGACGSYTITRTWTATDFCGNTTSDVQLINVLDQTKPEIFQLYTLEGGANLVAGYSQRVSNEWKYVRFPITFKATPVVFASISSNADASAVVVQVRNVTMQGFDMRLREEEMADGAHGNESVSWLAVDPSFNNGNLKWESGTLANVNETASPLSFKQSYTVAPLFFASSMTNAQSDPATLRQQNLTGAGAEVFAQEEQSADAEVTRVNETVGYMAINTNSILQDKDGNVFGEAGSLNVTNAWATVTLSKKYTKPVVIVSGLSKNDGQAVTLRVRNVANNRFDVRLQEWNYLDGTHPAESISWMVVEGSVPADESFYCKSNGSKLKPNVNIFAVDNCDDLVSFAYNASDSRDENGLVQNHTWTAIDDCGNTTLISRNDTCQVAALKVKALLNGATINSTTPGKMRDDLRVKNFVPKIEPYTGMNSFSYVQYQGHGSDANNNDNDDDDLKITICHLPGTDQQSTMEIDPDELAYHLSIGDNIGECQIVEPDKVTICHKPGTAAQKTLVISTSALLAHLAHGDIIGDCTGAGNEISTGASTAQYKTIADGEWTNTATWENGSVPPTNNVTNATISILHKVIVPSGGIKLGTGSKLYVTSGSLKLAANTFEVQNAQVYFDRSVLELPAVNSSLNITNSAAIVKFKDSQVSIGKSIVNGGGKIKMDHVELLVGGNYENNGGTDSLINVCATINGSISNSLLGKINISSTKLRLPNGNFTNLGIVNGSDLKLLIENGNLLNTGLGWTAPLLQYCISGTIGLTGSLLPAVEDCNNISNLFNPCDCYDLTGTSTNSGSGNTGVVSNVVTEINKGKSYGNGELDDPAATLAVTGDDAVVDWMMVEIRNMNNEAQVLGYQSVVLKRNGQVMGENGDSLLVFPGLDEGDYYVTVRHRNHLGVTTNDPIFLSIVDPPLVDFTNTSMLVKGGGPAGRLSNGKRTLWSGDFNGDGKVIYQGPFNDVFTLFSKVVGHSENTTNLANFIVNGYKTEDFNLDGKTIYQGPGNDRSYLLLNTILASPSNVTLLANFIVSDFIP